MKLPTAATALLAGLAGGAMVWLGQTGSFSIRPAEVSYPDLIAVMLTGVSILLAVVGIGLAIMAFLGWTTFRSMSQKAAGEAAVEHIKSDAGSEEIRNVLENKTLIFLQENLETAIALVEQRKREAADLGQVDADWQYVEVKEVDDGD